MFKDISEAFNHYRTMSLDKIEARAKDINSIIDTDPEAKIDELNIELEGLKEAKQNIVEARSTIPSNLKPVKDNNMKNENTNIIATSEYRSAFFKNLLGKELNEAEHEAWNKAKAEFRADAYSTVSEVAGVIPQATFDQVIVKARKIGGLLPRVRMLNFPAKVRIPVATPLSKADWNSEGAAVESTEPSISYVDFGNYEILKVLSVSASVAKMSIDSFESYLVDELSENILGCLADCVINGNGSGKGKGISAIDWVTTSGTTKNAVTFTGSSNTKLTYKDLIDAISLLPRGYANGALFIMNNKTLYNSVYSLMDGNNRPVFLQDMQTDKVGKILGFEVIVDDNVADNTIFFGNPKYYAVNMVSPIVVESSRESSFKSGRIDFRGMAIADCKPLVEGTAWIKLYKAE